MPAGYRRSEMVLLLPAAAARRAPISSSTARLARQLPRAQSTASSSALKAVGGPRVIAGLLALGGVAYVAYEMIQAGRSLDSIFDDLKNMLTSSLDEHSDPTPEDFLPSVLQSQLVPEQMQDGKLDEPYTTYVVQMEGTLLKKEFDRASGFKHMIRPHAEDALRLLVKASKGKAHVWFWGSDSQPQASTLTETLFLGSDDQRGVGMTTFQSLAPAFLGREHRFKDFDKVEEELEAKGKSGGEAAASAADATLSDSSHRLATEAHLVKRVQPLPRYQPSVVLVDHELRNFELNPDNTILVPEFTDYDEADDAMMTVVAFAQLFRSLYRRKEVRTASECLRWLKARHPDIAINPYRMGEYIREESSVISSELELLDTQSLTAVAKDFTRHTLIGKGRAITPSSTRLGSEHVPDGSHLQIMMEKMKKRNQQWQEKQLKAARKAAGEE